MNKNNYIYLLVSLLLLCCKNKEQNIKDTLVYSNQDFNQIQILTSKKLDFISNKLVTPSNLLLLGNYLLFLDRNTDKPIHFIDIKMEKYIGSYGAIGRGPNETIIPWNISEIDSNSFMITDIGQRKALGFNIDTLRNNGEPFLKKMFFQKGAQRNVLKYNEKLLFVDDNDFSNRLFEVSIKDDDTMRQGYGTVPYLLEKEFPDYIKAQAAQVIMKNKRNFFVFAYKFTPRIEIFNYTDNKWKGSVPTEIYYPKYKKMGEHYILKGNSLLSYLDLCLTEKYIYALYVNKKIENIDYPHGDVILVYDYMGKPIKKYALDKNISQFAVKDDLVIYGLNLDDTPEILKFDLKN